MMPSTRATAGRAATRGLLLLALVPLACTPLVVVEASDDAGSGGAGSSASTGNESTGDVTSGGPGGVQHASCSQPLSGPMPALPEIDINPDGNPRLADWQSIDCAEVDRKSVV